MELITIDNTKPFLYYNKCYMCGSKRNLSECNNCIELYCTACDLLLYHWCSSCKYRTKIKAQQKKKLFRLF